MIRVKKHLGIRAVRLFIFSLALLTTAPRSTAQAPAQQYVYANAPATTTTSTNSAYAKNGQTASLSAVPGSPFADPLEGGRLAVDALGRFLFVLNKTTSSISMYQIDSATGRLTEVLNSPFAAGPTINPNQAPAQPISIAVEKSGKYLYVGYVDGNISGFSAITPFAIDATNLKLTLTDQLSFDVSFNPFQMFSDPRGLFLYVGSGPNPFNGQQSATTAVYAINPPDGALFLNGTAGGSGQTGRCIASDPQGRFFFDGWGRISGFIDSSVISPLDGTTTAAQQTLDLGPGIYPQAMVVDSSGKFLYVEISSGLVIYSIDQNTGILTALTTPLPSPVFLLGSVVADPAGPFIFSAYGNGVHAYQVDAQIGALAEIPGSPFTTGGGANTIAISGTTVQAVSGPSAAFTSTSLNFGSVTEGHPVTLATHLVNNGDQTLSINLAATATTGPNKADFSLSTTCIATLAPNANCSFSVSFNPSAAANESATLQVTDNAPGSPQAISLSGTGLAPTPEIAFVPGNLIFSSIGQGVTEGPQSIAITNVGSAPLHVTTIALGGANPTDFSQTNNCTNAPLAVNATCSVNVTFTPLATGGRSATLSISDDAPGSSQTLSLQGTATAAFQLTTTATSTTTASVTPGQTAQYSLQLAPGTGFNGMVSLSCTGAPLATICSVSPNSLTVSTANPAPFSVMVSTTGSALAPPAMRTNPFSDWRNYPLAVVAALLMFFLIIWMNDRKGLRVARSLAACAALCLAVLLLGASGCGGSAYQVPPPQRVITPKGTYILTATATSGTLPPQSLPLTLTVN